MQNYNHGFCRCTEGLSRLLHVRAALQETIVDQTFDAWITKHKGFVVLPSQCIDLVNFTFFWSGSQIVIDVVKPLC